MSVELNRKHPDVHQPWAEWSEEQTLHLVLVYSNPLRWQTRRRLANDAIRHFLNCPNVRLYVVELAFDQRPFELTSDIHAHPNLVCLQVRTDCVLFHKESLINYAVRHFPSEWQYGGYWDADFTTPRHDWALEAIHMLQHHQFVQLFSSYTDITGTSATSFDGNRPYRMTSSFAWNYLHQREFKEFWEDRIKNRRKGQGDDYGVAAIKGEKFPYGLPPGATGGGWAWRRQAFNTVGGLLDMPPLGSADWHMAFGLAELTNVAAEMKRCTQPYVAVILQWQARAAKLKLHPGKSAIGCIDHHVIHHFHGSKSKRQYGERWYILRNHSFDPNTDLTRDWQGLWRWSGNKPELRDEVMRYMETRNEDLNMLLGTEREMV